MKKVVLLILVTAFLLSVHIGYADNNSPPDASHAAGGTRAAGEESSPDSGWERFFAYDEAVALQVTVKAAIPGEEESFSYPWGEYDALPESEEGSIADAGGDGLSADEAEQRIQQALERLSPELRKAAEEAMRQAQAQQSEANAPKEQDLPADWNEPSNQPELGGWLKLMSGDVAVILELSEYCVPTDTIFTVTPVKATGLPEEFIKGCFLLRGADREASVTLDDYAVITFVTAEDPGEDLVIKNLDANGNLEYTPAEVVKWGNTYRITGTVTHFSTVGYGPAELSAQAEAAMAQLDRNLVEQTVRPAEKAYLNEKWAKEYAERSHVRTISFDEILFTTTVRGDPCQLHLRAKLVEQPDRINAASGGFEATYSGKVWIKAYFSNPGAGYGEMYYLCNNMILEDPMLWGESPNGQGRSAVEASFSMTTISGSKGVAYGIGEYNFTGRGYSMQSVWEIDEDKGSVKVTFTSFKGFSEKTFVTGRLREVTKRQANKQLKWFLD